MSDLELKIGTIAGTIVLVDVEPRSKLSGDEPMVSA